MEKNLTQNILNRYGTTMKPLITEYRNDKNNRQAAVYATLCLGYEVIFFKNDEEVDKQSLIRSNEMAEHIAKTWVNSNNEGEQ